MEKRRIKFWGILLVLAFQLMGVQASNSIATTHDITEDMIITTNYESSEGNIENLVDGQLETKWKAIFKQNGYIELDAGHNGYRHKNIFSQKISFYSTTATNTIRGIKILVETKNGADSFEELKPYTTPQWIVDSETGLYKYDIDLTLPTMSPQVRIILDGDNGQEFELAGIKFFGELLEENLALQAKVYKNGDRIYAKSMVDSDIETAYESGWARRPNPDEYVFDFSPQVIDLEAIFYAVNFPLDQGVKKMKIDYFENGVWNNLDVAEFNWRSNNQRRETFRFDGQHKRTSKVRISCLDNNTTWEKVVFSEVFFKGQAFVTAQSLADKIVKVPNPRAGQQFLHLPDIGKEYEDDYKVVIQSSSNENILSTNGIIHPTSQDNDVDIIFKVIDKRNSQNTGITNLFKVHIPADLQDGQRGVYPKEDKERFINNPAMGWVLYYEGFECRVHNDPKHPNLHTDLCMINASDIEYYWQEIDEMIIDGLKPTTLYMRMQWSWYEPEEGQYAWNDPTSEMSRLIAGARARGLQLAFRVLVDSTDTGFQATPQWVFDAGATGYASSSIIGPATDPYIDSPVFIEKLGNFLDAFGAKFNDPEMNVGFIDGMGLGNWGEIHDIRTNHGKSHEKAVEGVVKLYSASFPDVLLGAQLSSTGDMKAINDYGYMIRRDSFGSVEYLADAEKNKILGLFRQGVPVYAENVFHHFATRAYRWRNNPESYPDDIFNTMSEMLYRVANDALYCRANTLDFRTLEDTRLWLNETPEVMNNLAIGLGYRLVTTGVEFPSVMKASESYWIKHSWKNTGVGFLPNNNSRWSNKYKVAFALLDADTDEVVYQYNEDTRRVNPSTWLKEKGVQSYNTLISIPQDLGAGTYKLAYAIVNDKRDWQPEIELAVKDMDMTEEGWYILDTVQIAESQYDSVYVRDFDEIDQVSGQGKALLINDKLVISALESHNNFIDNKIPENTNGTYEGVITPMNNNGRFKLIFRYQGNTNYAAIGYDINNKWFWTNGREQGILTTSGPRISNQETATVKVKYNEKHIVVWVDGQEIFNGEIEALPVGIGKNGIGAWYTSSIKVMSLKLTEATSGAVTERLFNQFYKFSGTGVAKLKDGNLIIRSNETKNNVIDQMGPENINGTYEAVVTPNNDDGRFKLIFRYQDSNSFAAIGYDINNKWIWENGQTYGTITTSGPHISAGQTAKIVIQYENSFIRLLVNDQIVFEGLVETLPVQAGKNGLGTWFTSNVEFDLIKISQ